MPQFQVAHIREQGQDMVIVVVNSSFGNKTSQEQNAIMADLQIHSRAACLAGIVVAVWSSGSRLMFRAPRQWHPFFASLTPQMLQANINKTLSW
jgi:hypothetical protein